jgi:hypothetical protein
LDERIDRHQSMDWIYGNRAARALFHGAPTLRYRQYYRPIDSPEDLGCNRSIAAGSSEDGKDMPGATWEPHEKHGRLTMQSDLPGSVYAFPKQRKEPLTDAQHVRNAVARFDQVINGNQT